MTDRCPPKPLPEIVARAALVDPILSPSVPPAKLLERIFRKAGFAALAGAICAQICRNPSRAGVQNRFFLRKHHVAQAPFLKELMARRSDN